MDHSKHTPLMPTELSEAVLSNVPIYDTNDRKVGTISHVHGSGAGVVVDVGGILGIGSKPVLVDAKHLNLMRDEKGAVHGLTLWSKEDLKALTEHRD